MDNQKQVVHDGWDEYANKRIYKSRGKIGIFRSIGFGAFSFFSISMQGLVAAWLIFFLHNILWIDCWTRCNHFPDWPGCRCNCITGYGKHF
ncbi:hypothetical protein C5L28_001792 [Lentilactobacillus parakefiri]|uniref:Major facilitator superfamily transporter n=1 Tax=Lentilactobacillus parakefiri TaxID=152332 RepID=A0A224VLH2_9LACO|nr:hypothetical protein C5L28_001792 [Lentilactobacillus parakefiri]GAW72990.1 major facilitator superfamily transporter [Lentilactobacillus parakefiri]